ncbi:MAG TPA: adenylate/guanylate cyclase domain-containing protein [Herpetosiphonaceae bacterium]
MPIDGVEGRQQPEGRAPRATVADTRDLLRQAELDGERVAALFRLVICASLLSVVAFTDQGLHRLDISTWLFLYGVGMLVGIGLARRGIFHPSIPYLFVTFDIVMVSIQLLLLTQMIGMPPSHSFAMPVAALVFVIMVHASMRYRPWLVVYAAALFVVTVEAGAFLLSAGDGALSHGMRMADQGMLGNFMLFQAFPITIVGLSAVILLVTGQRTRRLLFESIDQTYRAAKLSRYFSPNLAERLAASPDEQLLAGSRQRVAVLFVDIRGFTAMAEAMDPKELGGFLSEFRGRLSAPIFSHDGTVDKFIGDAIMAVFGAPLSHADDARRALNCALDMLDAVGSWSQEREKAGLPLVSIGIGGHYGEVFAGALGDQHLLEYTVIGDTVNVAERLERLTREFGSPLVVSARLLAAAGERIVDDRWVRLAAQTLPGHRAQIEAFAMRSSHSGTRVLTLP